MSRIWMPGGGGGVDLDVVTALTGDVLKGKVIVGPNGEPLTGVLELTGNAADSQVLSGKTYYNTDAKTKRTGTMPNQGAVAPSGLNAGGSYTIPAGYHNGSGKVTANSLASQTDGSAGAGDILNEKTAWVKGSKVIGNIKTQSAKTQALNCGGSVELPAGYYASASKITANSLASQTGGVTAGDADVRKGKTYWKDGSKRTGTMAEKAAATITPGTSNQNIAANQYLTGAQTIKGDANLVAANIISGKSIFGVAGNAKVYKYLNVAVTSSASRITFKDSSGNSLSHYCVTHGAIDFTPQMFLCRHAGRAAEVTFLTSPGATMLGLTGGDWKSSTVWDIVISENCYWGKSGFKIPVYTGSQKYQLMIFGY